MTRLEHVAHDPAAARAAARACRDGADDLRAAAAMLDGAMAVSLTTWSGATRIDFDGTAAELADDLRTEATALDGTAEAIDEATAAAVTEDGRRRAEVEAERRRVEEAARAAVSCTPTGGR